MQHVLIYWFSNRTLSFGVCLTDFHKYILLSVETHVIIISVIFVILLTIKLSFSINYVLGAAQWVGDVASYVCLCASWRRWVFRNHRQTEVTRWHSALNKAIEILLLVTAAALNLCSGRQGRWWWGWVTLTAYAHILLLSLLFIILFAAWTCLHRFYTRWQKASTWARWSHRNN